MVVIMAMATAVLVMTRCRMVRVSSLQGRSADLNTDTNSQHDDQTGRFDQQ